MHTMKQQVKEGPNVCDQVGFSENVKKETTEIWACPLGEQFSHYDCPGHLPILVNDLGGWITWISAQ